MMKNKSLSDRRQDRIIFLSVLTYSFAYLGRYSYNSNINMIIGSYSVSHASAGLVSTLFFFAYGIGQFINGALSRHYSERYAIPLALLFESAVNLFVFCGIPFGAIKYLWLLNGLAQSVLWPTIISVTSRNLDSAHLKKSILAYSVTTTLGTFLSYGTSALFVNCGNFRFSFLAGSLLPLAMGMIWMIFFKPVHASAEKEEKIENDTKAQKGNSIIIIIAVLALFSVFDNFAKDGLQTWIPNILKENFGLRDDFSILLSLCLPVIGMLGGFFAVFAYKKIRELIPLASIFFICGALFLFIMKLNDQNMIVSLICISMTVFFMHAVNNVATSMAPILYRERISSGMLAGMLNGFCYLGSTISTYSLGKIADISGWNTVFLVLISSLLFASISGFVFTFSRKK